MKALKIEDKGYVWELPLSAVADNRAKYYAERDKDTTYKDEFDHVMSDSYEGIDWFLNNMNFSDVADKATLVVIPPHPTEPDVTADGCVLKIVDR